MIDSHGMNLNLVFKLWFESHEVITLSVYVYDCCVSFNRLLTLSVYGRYYESDSSIKC